MKSNMMTIIRKELARFFGDRRMVFTTILMPGLMIYVMYSLMGSFMMDKMTGDDTYVATAYVQNMPEELKGVFEELSVDWKDVPADKSNEELLQEVQDEQVEAFVVFPENFMAQVAAYDVSSATAAPNVEIYYNSADTESAKLYRIVETVLNEVEASVSNKLDVNAGDKKYDCASDAALTGQMFSMILPMLLMIFLYSGCISVAPESIAGEKERGTIATLLVTPMKRSSLALGKVLSLSAIALLSGISSFVGTFLSLPKLMGGEMTGIDSSVYAITDYGMLLGIILSTVIVLVALISVISAFAKSIKEAGTAVSPLMIVIMVISLIPMFGDDAAKELYVFLIPLYNSVQCMHGIFSFSYEPIQVLVTICINVVAAGILSYVLTRLFNSEKVMFAK